MSSQTPIDTLPNELLIDILSPFSTADILPLLPISRHFHSVILRILRQRLTRATSLPDHRLILEAYHPSAKLSTPYLYCDYLYTDQTLHGKEQEEQTGGSDGGTLQSLSQTYSHFRPVVQEENQRARARYRSRLLAQQSSSGDGEGGGGDAKPPPEWQLETIPSHEVFLDEDEMFSQLCTVTNLVKTGPKPGLFLSHVNVSDGLIRIKRDWLAARARKGGDSDDEDAILWADAARTVGVRFRVREMDTGIERPVLVAEGEEIAVSYRLEYVELLVRTSRLLMMVEKSEGQEIDPQGGAVVIAAV